MTAIHDMTNIPSEATDVILAANHPGPDDCGPCATCAFRPGTVPNQTPHTMVLARLCVEGLTPFHCHEHERTCRGWNAAVNLRGAPVDEDDHKWAETCAAAADVLGDAIQAGVEADSAFLTKSGEKK